MARILLFSADVVGSRMAGPGIRYWELAHELARWHEVTLAVPAQPDITSETVRLVDFSTSGWEQVLRGHDVCVTQLVWPKMLLAARRYGVRLVADAYDPIVLEDLENHKGTTPAGRRARNRRSLSKTRLTLTAADAVVCASDRQRDLWLGHLMALDRVRPDAYDADPSMTGVVGVVPFGMPRIAPERTGPGFRAALGIGDDETVLLWGGGVWNWFDPLTLVEAVADVVADDPSIHLVFMGLRHPNTHVPASAMAARTVELAETLGLLDKHVHANAGWVPYQERQNHLLDADVGVSTHFGHLETRFSFRTRILDYLWAGLPLLLTEGDVFGDLVAREGLGRAVPEQDRDALSEAIRQLAGNPAERASAREAVARSRAGYTWEAAGHSLNEVIGTVLDRPPRTSRHALAVADFYAASARELVVERRTGELVQRVRAKARR